MEDSVEGPSATKKQKIEDRGILRKLSGAAIIVYTGRIAARAKAMVRKFIVSQAKLFLL